MLASSAGSVIRLKGVRQNNLKNFDLDLPLNHLIVITGLSGSGKSSLAFDTLFAEGQRRYIETFSPYARQFFERMDKPQVDSIEGIPPAIAIEQRNAVKTTRSTVGTMTEICDYMKVLWPHLARLHCRNCGQPVRKEPPDTIWKMLRERYGATAPEVLVTFTLPLTEKLGLQECLALVSKQGYQRLLLEDKVVRLDEFSPGAKKLPAITVIQDRVKLSESSRARFVEASEQAYHFGKGKLSVRELRDGLAGLEQRFSRNLHCAACDLEYREPSPALFSFNHPVGACPTCRGFGRVISIDYRLAMPDLSRTLAQGVVKPWQTGLGAECQADLMRMCRLERIPTDIPFRDLSRKWQDYVVQGEPGYGKDAAHEWPHAWYGVKGYFRWLESKAYKMHVRVLLSRYRAYTPCPDCGGKRFQPEALLYRTPGTQGAGENPGAELTLADFYQLPIRDALQFLQRRMDTRSTAHDGLRLAFEETRARLQYLEDVGLGYLTLDRPTRSLSGGETERVNLTTCLGTRLVNTLFVLDEPSVGLHPSDTDRLVRILQQLRDSGNTVVVVEHEAAVIRAADYVVDLGPGHGASGGKVVFQGSGRELLHSESSLTGKYLSGRERIEIPRRRPVVLPRDGRSALRSRSVRFIEPATPDRVLEFNEAPVPYGRTAPADPVFLSLSGANRHNLKNLTVQIPLGRFVCITGVSGSGKTTLVREVLVPAVTSKLSAGEFTKASERFDSEPEDEEQTRGAASSDGDSVRLEGAEHVRQAVLVDQSTLGKTPRSNPAVYIGAFEEIREVFAQSEQARQRGLNASAFSFNSAQGQCERCRGAGFEKIEMQFLSDVFIRCPDCNGRRYRSHILDVKTRPHHTASPRQGGESHEATAHNGKALSIADLLQATVDEAVAFLAGFEDSRPAARAMQKLRVLQEVGLGYLELGQPINTLSGGESQRLKLVRHLAEASGETADSRRSQEVGTPTNRDRNESRAAGGTLFLFDEPTTGLHFDDVRILLKVFQRLVDAGNSVLVIEHNLDVIQSADWVIDLGPGAGDQGGRVVATGTPETIVDCAESETGLALRHVLGTSATAPERGRRRAERLANS